MRVVEVDRHYLFRNWGSERARDLSSDTFGQIEAEHWVISGRCWFKRSVLELLCIVSSLNTRLEYIYASRNISSRSLRVVSANSRISLFEVYIYCDWFHKVQRIILVKGQSKASLRVELRSFRILLHKFWIILAWPKINLRVTALFQPSLGETVSFRHKTIPCPLYIMTHSAYY